MNTAATTRRGTPELVRVLPGIGRIRRAYGTDDPETISDIKVMVKTLYKTGQWTYLEALRDGKLSPLQVYQSWSNQQLAKMPTPESLERLAPALESWVSTYDGINEKSRENYRIAFRVLCKSNKHATVADLPKLVKAYRVTCQQRGTSRMFNSVRNAARSYVKNTVGAFSQLYADVSNVQPLNDSPQRGETAWDVPTILTLMDTLRANGNRDPNDATKGAGVPEIGPG